MKCHYEISYFIHVHQIEFNKKCPLIHIDIMLNSSI